MILNFENYITEKLGISEDVLILYNFLSKFDFNKNRIIIDNNIPKTTFQISKIIINIKNDYSSFNVSRSKLIKNGFIIYLNIKDDNIEASLFHELTHVIKFQNLTNKKIKMLSSSINYNDERFKKLLDILYYCDESEINSKLSEIYKKILDISKFYKDNFIIDKNELFSKIISEKLISEIGEIEYIKKYNIFEDLKNISDKDKIKFFKYITNIKKIKSYNKIKAIIEIIKLILFNKENENVNISTIMQKTQKYIDIQIGKLERKVHKLYDMI